MSASSDIATDVLDELVHDTASATASNVNNGGFKAQLEYLLANGFERNDIDVRLRVNGLSGAEIEEVWGK